MDQSSCCYRIQSLADHTNANATDDMKMCPADTLSRLPASSIDADDESCLSQSSESLGFLPFREQ